MSHGNFMNTLNKKDLLDLFCLTQDFMNKEFTLPSYNRCIQLQNKLSEMIDSYCEHDWHKVIHLFNNVYCTKCLKNFEVNNVMTDDERERNFKIYREKVLPQYDNDPNKVPPHLEPDFNEGWNDKIKIIYDLMDLLPPCIDTKENEPFNYYWLEVKKRRSLHIRYIVRYVCDSYSNPIYERVLVKTYSSNLDKALEEMFTLLLDKGFIDK